MWCVVSGVLPKIFFLFCFDLYLALYAPKCSKIHVLAIRDSFRGDVHKLGWYIYKFDKHPHPTGIWNPMSLGLKFHLWVRVSFLTWINFVMGWIFLYRPESDPLPSLLILICRRWRYPLTFGDRRVPPRASCDRRLSLLRAHLEQSPRSTTMEVVPWQGRHLDPHLSLYCCLVVDVKRDEGALEKACLDAYFYLIVRLIVRILDLLISKQWSS
jgi:hypothetical protein